jgi:bacterial/archaeal transporter family-2 protein
MNWTYIIPLAVGAAGIIQGGLNKNMSQNMGLTMALFIGNTLVVIYSIFLYFLAAKSPESVGELFKLKASTTGFKWWYIIPSICGFLIISGIPFGISKIGAVKVTVLIIAGQMITSLLWDIFVEKIPFNSSKTLGVFFSALSLFFILK